MKKSHWTLDVFMVLLLIAMALFVSGFLVISDVPGIGIGLIVYGLLQAGLVTIWYEWITDKRTALHNAKMRVVR